MTGRDREPIRVLSKRVSEVLVRDTCARILVMSSAYHRCGAVLVMAVEQVRPLESRVSNVISRNRCLCLRFSQILRTFSQLSPHPLRLVGVWNTFSEFGGITSRLLGFGWVVGGNAHVGVVTQVFTHPDWIRTISGHPLRPRWLIGHFEPS